MKYLLFFINWVLSILFAIFALSLFANDDWLRSVIILVIVLLLLPPSRRILEKIVQKANDRGKIPMMVLSYKKAECPTPADWVVIPMDLFKKVMKGDKNEK